MSSAAPMAHQRLFFALWPDEELAGHLHALGDNLVEHAGNGRAMAAATLHLTLAFVGSVTAAQRDLLIDSAGALRAPAIEVSLDRLAFWPRGGIVHLRATANVALVGLMHGLSACLRGADCAIDSRPPAPHVTLARNVRGPDLPRLGTPMHWTAREFLLVESHLQPGGARYRTLERWQLG